jgi:hypothetical protein
VQREIAEAQATVLSAGLEKADIDIVGGDSVFFDRLMSSITMGKSVDGFMEHSAVAQAVAGPYLNGSASLPQDLSRMFGALDTADVRNLTLSALLVKLIQAGGPDADKLRDLLSTAQRLGVAEQPVEALSAAAR